MYIDISTLDYSPVRISAHPTDRNKIHIVKDVLHLIMSRVEAEQLLVTLTDALDQPAPEPSP